jgi:hypothetical protein
VFLVTFYAWNSSLWLRGDSDKMRAWAYVGGLAVFQSSLVAFVIWQLFLRARVRAAGGCLCPFCKYSLAKLPGSGLCPECGRPYPEDLYLAFWSRWFPSLKFDPEITGKIDSVECVRRAALVRRLLRFANVALSLTILFCLLPSMNCMASLLRGCKCYSEWKEVPTLLGDALTAAMYTFLFATWIGPNLEWQIYDWYVQRQQRASSKAKR